jgi:phosphopantothenate-cysteine ligase
VVRESKRVKQLGTLHTVTFVTVDDYLFLLRGIAGVLGGKLDGKVSAGENTRAASSTNTSANMDLSVGREAMYYLAAAVSDFFLPRQKMVRHSTLLPDLYDNARLIYQPSIV